MTPDLSDAYEIKITLNVKLKKKKKTTTKKCSINQKNKRKKQLKQFLFDRSNCYCIIFKKWIKYFTWIVV